MRSLSERAKNAGEVKEVGPSIFVSLNRTRFIFIFKVMASLTLENFSTSWTPG